MTYNQFSEGLIPVEKEMVSYLFTELKRFRKTITIVLRDFQIVTIMKTGI